MDIPPIRYARTADAVNIAYQVLGEGPADLIVIPGVVSNIEIFWETPRWSRFMERLSTFSRLLLFDRRGVGLSDRPGGVLPLQQRMDDVRAVLDAAGGDRAAGPPGQAQRIGAARALAFPRARGGHRR